MTIRLRCIFGDELRLRPQLKIYPASYEGGLGPFMPAIGEGGSGPIPSQTIFDRFDVPILDRAGAEIETRA
jgi:hypothetical protein